MNTKNIKKFEKQLRDQQQISYGYFFRQLNQTHKTIPNEHNVLQTLQSLNQKGSQRYITENFASPKTQTPFCDSQAQHNCLSNNHKQKISQKNRKSSKALTQVTFNNESNSMEMNKKRKKWLQLKQVLTGQKVNNLIQTFTQKLKRNNQYSQPVQFQISNNSHKKSILDKQGFDLSEFFDQLFSIVMILDIMISLFLYTLAMVFPEVADSLQLVVFQSFSIMVYMIEMSLNFLQKKTIYGRKLQSIRQISQRYLRSSFVLDLINLLAIILSISTKLQIFNFFRLAALSKISHVLQKLQKIQIYLIQNYYNEQYWSLIKTFIFNFCFAHILAILLIVMTNIDLDHNWMVVREISEAYWVERYVWSYYWGINIMLTVGFGDIVPSTYQEACCLIFIQTISCLALAYNINCVGNLIANIRAQDLEKSKNFKIFKKMVDKGNISAELSEQINNYIDQSINIKKNFNLQEQQRFVEKLPTSFRTQVLREQNKNIFQKLTFFHSLMQKTLFSLAQKIEMSICHPQEIIQPLQDSYNLLILKSGELGYICKKPGSNFNNKMIDNIKVGNEDKAYLINLNFITKKRQNFEIKSIAYSVIYYLQHQKLIQILKESPMDFQLYAYLRDKNKNVLDQFQIFKCEFCKTRHTKFICPKIHYMPLNMHVINKWLQSYRTNKNKRVKSFYRIYRLNNSPFSNSKKLQELHFIDSKKFRMDQRETLKFSALSRFTQMRRKRRVDKAENDINKMQLFFMEQTTEIIKEQLAKIMGAQEFVDQIWNLQLDRMKNYKGYFLCDNPSNLKEKFNVNQRLQKLKQASNGQSSFQMMLFGNSERSYRFNTSSKNVDESSKQQDVIDEKLSLRSCNQGKRQPNISIKNMLNSPNQ